MTTGIVENYSYVARFSLVLRGCPDNAGIMTALIKTFATYTINNVRSSRARPVRVLLARHGLPTCCCT